ncbi:hypothetical protein B0H12DRAFT_575374 [Mycena haematopus]|nr:hypothetical protein B0H12DRAFT_575374 [Mycena haematopus]
MRWENGRGGGESRASSADPPPHASAAGVCRAIPCAGAQSPAHAERQQPRPGSHSSPPNGQYGARHRRLDTPSPRTPPRLTHSRRTPHPRDVLPPMLSPAPSSPAPAATLLCIPHASPAPAHAAAPPAAAAPVDALRDALPRRGQREGEWERAGRERQRVGLERGLWVRHGLPGPRRLAVARAGAGARGPRAAAHAHADGGGALGARAPHGCGVGGRRGRGVGRRRARAGRVAGVRRAGAGGGRRRGGVRWRRVWVWLRERGRGRGRGRRGVQRRARGRDTQAAGEHTRALAAKAAAAGEGGAGGVYVPVAVGFRAWRAARRVQGQGQATRGERGRRPGAVRLEEPIPGPLRSKTRTRHDPKRERERECGVG